VDRRDKCGDMMCERYQGDSEETPAPDADGEGGEWQPSAQSATPAREQARYMLVRAGCLNRVQWVARWSVRHP